MRFCLCFCVVLGGILSASGANKGHFTKPNFTFQGHQLSPFTQLAHGVSTGPITILDDRTFFVTDLHYDGKAPDVYFWVGKGGEPSRNGIKIPGENGSLAPLPEYLGKNVTVKLPDGLTIDQIDYFGVWCVRFAQNLGHVVMPWALKNDSGVVNITVVSIAKCCPIGQALTQNGCQSLNTSFVPRIKVHEHNATHLNDYPLEHVEFVPFVNSISCPFQKYPLIPGEDRFALLKNGSLMILDKHQLLTQEAYCLETVNLGDGPTAKWITTPIVCFSSADVPLAGAVFIVYASGILLSAVFLIITVLVFFFVKEVRDTRGKCVIGYSASMAVAFVCLAFAQFAGVNEEACAVIGFFIQAFLVAAFTWLSNLSWETYIKIRKYNSQEYSQDKRRWYYYVGIGFVVPVLVLALTLVFDRMPAIPNTLFKPEFGNNSCWFDQKQWTMVYFYLPVATAIVFNIALSILMKWQLVWLERHRSDDIAWIAVKRDLKPMYRSCGFLLALMTLSWVMEIVSFLAQTESGIWTAVDIINSLQGFLVFLIFVLHRPVKNKLHLCAFKVSKQTMQYEKPSSDEEVRLNGLKNGEFVTKLNQGGGDEPVL